MKITECTNHALPIVSAESGGEALRDDPNNGCEGDYAKYEVLIKQYLRSILDISKLPSFPGS